MSYGSCFLSQESWTVGRAHCERIAGWAPPTSREGAHAHRADLFDGLIFRVIQTQLFATRLMGRDP
jgi:hypothetical protein